MVGTNLIHHINNASILAETKMHIMQQAVAKYSKVFISAHGIKISSLLDSGNEVTLLWQSNLVNIYCQKVNQQLVRKLMLTPYSDLQLPMMGRCQ